MPECVLESGARVHWLAEGNPDGPPVVWIHAGSVEESSHVVADLKPYWPTLRVFYPDARGHGLSQKSEKVEENTYAWKARDLIQWLDAQGIRDAVFGGPSMGGALSLYIASHYPERTRAIISISGPPYGPTPGDRAWWQAKRHLVAAGEFEAFYVENVRLRMSDDVANRLAADPERLKRATRGLRDHSVATLLAVLDETYSRADWVEDCAAIRCPALIISGAEDHFPTEAMSRRVAQVVPGAELHVVEGAGHFPLRSHREQVQPLLEAFFRRISAGA